LLSRRFHLNPSLYCYQEEFHCFEKLKIEKEKSILPQANVGLFLQGLKIFRVSFLSPNLTFPPNTHLFLPSLTHPPNTHLHTLTQHTQIHTHTISPSLSHIIDEHAHTHSNSLSLSLSFWFTHSHTHTHFSEHTISHSLSISLYTHNPNTHTFPLPLSPSHYLSLSHTQKHVNAYISSSIHILSPSLTHALITHTHTRFSFTHYPPKTHTHTQTQKKRARGRQTPFQISFWLASPFKWKIKLRKS